MARLQHINGNLRQRMACDDHWSSFEEVGGRTREVGYYLLSLSRRIHLNRILRDSLLVQSETIAFFSLPLRNISYDMKMWTSWRNYVWTISSRSLSAGWLTYPSDSTIWLNMKHDCRMWCVTMSTTFRTTHARNNVLITMYVELLPDRVLAAYDLKWR